MQRVSLAIGSVIVIGALVAPSKLGEHRSPTDHSLTPAGGGLAFPNAA
jgi:hypothetical protein